MAAPKLIDAAHDGPQRIDRYDLVAEIASGGMATVYLARLSGVGGFRRFVAIKRLHPHLAGEQEFVEMFLDEARLAAGIHHPNVVPILEVGASDRGYYLVMEYIEGDTLARLLARAASGGRRLPMDIGTRIVVDMLGGLHAAHELRDENGDPTELVHRDVSPQNVLVGMDGNTRITDFGVARAASRLSATRAGQLKGKIAYMAPEQAVGDPSVDRRADIFSSGIVLWEVLASKRLFKAENEAATLSRVISEEIPHICEVNPEVDEGVGRVVMTALERDRDARYPTCADFAGELEEAAQQANLLSPSRDVANYVAEVIGDEITQQREAVRAWLARSEPSQVSPDISGDAALIAAGGDHSGLVTAPVSAPLGDAPSEPPSRNNGVFIVAAAAVAGFIGVGAAVALMGQQQGPEPALDPTGPSVATAGAADLKAGAGTDETRVAGDSEEPEATVEPTHAVDDLPTADDATGTKDEAGKAAAGEGAKGEGATEGVDEAQEETPSAEAPAPKRVWRRRAAPKPKPKPKEEPKEEPKPAPSDIDLSNPYR